MRQADCLLKLSPEGVLAWDIRSLLKEAGYSGVRNLRPFRRESRAGAGGPPGPGM